jgi:hypothetical protein
VAFTVIIVMLLIRGDKAGAPLITSHIAAYVFGVASVVLATVSLALVIAWSSDKNTSTQVINNSDDTHCVVSK